MVFSFLIISWHTDPHCIHSPAFVHLFILQVTSKNIKTTVFTIIMSFCESENGNTWSQKSSTLSSYLLHYYCLFLKQFLLTYILLLVFFFTILLLFIMHKSC